MANKTRSTNKTTNTLSCVFWKTKGFISRSLANPVLTRVAHIPVGDGSNKIVVTPLTSRFPLSNSISTKIPVVDGVMKDVFEMVFKAVTAAGLGSGRVRATEPNIYEPKVP